MNECITGTHGHFTPAASLAAVGVKLQEMKLFEAIEQRVQIAQKTVKYRPIDKLYDGFIALLAGAHGMVEINTRLRSDPALQAAFGRTACAEQSVVQQTLDCCTAENVQQMEQAIDNLFRHHSQAAQHDYQASWQILDVDLSGWLCGKKAAFATKGYFADAPRNRRGRQLGRVLASRYQEVVVDRLFAGNCQLNTTLQELMQAAQTTLQLSREQRARCLVRFDAGGGSVLNFNWLLEQNYHILGKACSAQQAQRLARSVQQWYSDAHVPGREVGLVTETTSDFARPVRRIAVRCPKPNGQWGVGVLVCSFSDQDLWQVMPPSTSVSTAEHRVLLAMLWVYDQRGGGVETSFKGDKGIGLTKRNKKSFPAQQMLMLLGSLAHNVIIWVRQWFNAALSTEFAETTLTHPSGQEPLKHYGPLRMVRDVLHISGFLRWDSCDHLVEIVLNQDTLLAHRILFPLRQLLAPMHVAINLGKN